jgi:stalled ribosome rescue protein Dom34
MGIVNVSRNDNEITFSAEDTHDLAVLYEQLEQGDIQFAYDGQTVITASLDQGNDVDALDKESYLDLVASQYQ